MTSADQRVDALRKKITIASCVDCQPAEWTTVQVLFARDGVEYQRTVIEQRPPFDQLCTVIVEGTSSPAIWFPPIRSARDAVSWLYRHALDADAKYGFPFRSNKPILDNRYTDADNIAHLLLEFHPTMSPRTTVYWSRYILCFCKGGAGRQGAFVAVRH